MDEDQPHRSCVYRNFCYLAPSINTLNRNVVEEDGDSLEVFIADAIRGRKPTAKAIGQSSTHPRKRTEEQELIKCGCRSGLQQPTF
ncbi:hypothetical protein ACOSP7_025856 [Xanthoceras sorbifolium]